jgi:hypothetical protein
MAQSAPLYPAATPAVAWPPVPTARFDRAACPFAVALVIAAVTRLAAPFDGLFGQDAFAYFRFAKAIGPHLFHAAPLPALYWPRGYPAAVAVLLPLVGGGPFAGQLVSALAIAWAAAATFLLVREFDRMRGGPDDPTARIVAGLSVAASGIALRTGQVVMADGLGIGLGATALWCLARYLRGGRGPWLVAAAVALAAGAITRWQVGLLAIPLGAAVAVAPRARPRGGGGWGWWIAAALAGLAVLVPQLVAAHAVPYALERHDWLLRWSPANAFGRDFDNREAHVHYRFPVGLFYLWRLGWPDALFPTVAALAVVGAWALVRERRALALALLVGWPAVNTAFVCGIPYENPRFLWQALPALGALVGLGYQAARARLPARARSSLALLFAASLAAGLALGAREHARTVARKNADRTVVDWLDATVPAGTTLLMPGGSLMAEHYGRVRVHDIYLLSPVDLPPLLARECPCFYLEDPGEMDGPLRGLPPQLVSQSLRRQPGLTAVASRGPLVLYRVGPPR